MRPTISSQTVPLSGERRAHARLRPSSITYIEVGQGNGGIVLNLGTGGLAFQAATRLNAAEKLTVRFRLPNSPHITEIAGEVAWLSPKRTEAGIAFDNLSSAVQQDIAEWIAKQERAYQAAALEAQSLQRPALVAPIPIANEPSVPSPVSVGRIPPRAISARPAPIPEMSASESFVGPGLENAVGLDFQSNGLAPSIGHPSDVHMPISVPLVRPEPLKAPLESQPLLGQSAARLGQASVAHPPKWPLDRLPLTAPPLPETALISKGSGKKKQITWRNWSVESPLAYSGDIAPGAEWTLRALSVAWSEALQRPKGMLASLLGSWAILLLLFSLALAHQAPRETVRPNPNRTWTPTLRKAFLGVDVDSNTKPGIDQQLAGVQVWISQDSGYYYCSDSPYYRTLQPGNLMDQGEALQSGYQPKLGAVCK